jgi:hypothetical protein
MATGKTVPPETKAEVDTVKPHEVLRKRMALNATVAGNTDPAVSREISDNIVDKILTADTVDDIFAAQQNALETLKDNQALLGLPLTITEFRFVESDQQYVTEDNPWGHFAIMEAVEDDGTLHMIGCGAPQVLATLDALDRKGALPFRVRFMSAGRSGRVIRVANASK